jgi:hypothetical protein
MLDSLTVAYIQFMIILTELKKVDKSEMKVGAKRTPYSRNSTMEQMEKMLSTWIEDKNQCHVPISMLLVQTKAYKNLSKGDDNVKSHSANTGWFSRFTKRYNFNSIKMTGEAVSTDYMAVNPLIPEIHCLKWEFCVQFV